MIERLSESERDQAVDLLRALESGWMIVDEEEGFDFILLVNESRTEMENFKPSKSFIKKIESMGLIKDRDATFESRPRETLVGYEAGPPNWELRAVPTLLPIVYFYDVTAEGRKFLACEQKH